MFSSIGWPEILVLLVIGLFVFGPDRLPTVARDAAGAMKKVREMVSGARAQIGEEFGEDFAGLQLTTLNPREFVRRQLMDENPEPLIKRSATTMSAYTPKPVTANGVDLGKNGVDPNKPTAPLNGSTSPARPGSPAPYDEDAT